MIKLNTAFIAACFVTLLTSCEAIGDIFKTGVWVGILVVVAVIFILFIVFRKRN